MDDVPLCKRLTTNMINFSQLCYHGPKVNPTEGEGFVSNEKNEVLMRKLGKRQLLVVDTLLKFLLIHMLNEKGR